MVRFNHSCSSSQWWIHGIDLRSKVSKSSPLSSPVCWWSRCLFYCNTVRNCNRTHYGVWKYTPLMINTNGETYDNVFTGKTLVRFSVKFNVATFREYFCTQLNALTETWMVLRFIVEFVDIGHMSTKKWSFQQLEDRFYRRECFLRLMIRHVKPFCIALFQTKKTSVKCFCTMDHVQSQCF